MAEQLDPNEFAGYKEALVSQIFTLDALIILLERKGLITKEEVVEEIKSPIDGFCKSYYCEAPHIGSGQWRVFALAKVAEVR